MIKFKNLISLNCLIYLGIMSPCLAQFRPDRPTFFEDGQRLMEQEIRRLERQQANSESNRQALEHPSQLLTIDDGTLRWQKHLFRDGGFSVWMPEGTRSEETVTIKTDAGNIDFEVVGAHPKSLRFIAAYSEENQDLSKLGNSEAILSSIRDGIIAETNFKLLQESPLNFESYNGTALKMKNEQEIINFRIYLINQKVYVLAAGSKNGDYEKDITSFFDSFRLLQ